MVGVAFEVFAQLLHDLVNVLLCEVGGAQNNGLSVWKQGGNLSAHINIKNPSEHCMLRMKRAHLNLNVSPSSEAFPGVISKMPLNGYGWPPYANSVRTWTHNTH